MVVPQVSEAQTVVAAESAIGTLAIGEKTKIQTRISVADEPKLIIPEPIAKTGKSYALIIGVKDYADKQINSLEFPIQDAKKIKDVLTLHYDFEKENITFLENPTRAQITKVLENYIDNINDNDKLLVFYAGHGYWDSRFKEGYWFPADAKKGDRSTWLANGTLKKYLTAIEAKHTMLISDACFSGSIFRVRDAFATDAAFAELERYPSRKAMTSGSMNTVPDKSVFVKYLVQRLSENNKPYLSAEQLFASFKIAVINNSPNNQVPQYGVIHEAGDEGGDFVFVRK